MENCSRLDPPIAGREKETLEAFLDYHRATLLCKVDGVGDEELRRAGTRSGVTLLGLVKHLAYVERWWFGIVFAGQDLPDISTEDDPDADWRIEPHETTEQVIAFYEDEVVRSRDITRGAELDEAAYHPSLGSSAHPTLRWILLHMLEETARHNGHADILREAIDGQTGE